MFNHWARRTAAMSCAAVVFCAGTVSVFAQSKVYSDEYLKHINAAKDVSALGDNMFGDAINDYTGSVQFSQADVSLPGNSALPVSVGRRYSADDKTGLPNNYIANGIFGDWDLDIPHLQGVYKDMHAMSSTTADKRCNLSGWDEALAPFVTVSNYQFQPDNYHRGKTLHLPGAGDEDVLWFEPSGTDKPTDALVYKWVTKGRWYFSCLTSTANGVAGDAFLARAPDGSKYWFNHVVQRWHPSITKPTGGGGAAAAMAAVDDSGVAVESTDSSIAVDSDPSYSASAAAGPQMVAMGRNEVWLLPTRVEDRFGNWVTYTYDASNPWRLTTINSSDGRQITLTYNTAGRVATVFDGTRTWTYTYNATTGFLTSVTLPDAGAWTIDFASLNGQYLPGSGKTYCGHPGSVSLATPSGTITHPSGAQGIFTFAHKWHGRQYTTDACQDFTEQGAMEPYYTMDIFPAFFQARSLISKQVSGPGMATRSWSWSYPNLSFSYASDCTSGCAATKLITVTQPDGSKHRQTYGTYYGVNEGLLLKSETLTSADVVVSTTISDYLTTGTGQAYPSMLGRPAQDLADPDAAYFKPLYRRQIVQDGTTFTWQVNNSGSSYSFDKYTNPLTVTRSSTGGAGGNFSRGETTAYHDNLSKWVLSQVASVIDTATGKVMSATTYHATSVLPLTISTFGVLQQTLTYNADGTVASVKDPIATHPATTLSSWYRGVPLTITYPTGVSETATVNPIGTLASTTDELGYSHGYGYDAMGRLASIAYPTGDTVAWTGTTRSFSKVAVTEYGIAAGHWKQVLATGNGRTTTFYDAQWRPLLVLTEDTGNAASKSFVVNRYDAAGRTSFVSYPVGTLTSVNDSLPGTSTSYDALGRPTSVTQTAEAPHGTLTTTTEYLTGFQTRVTNPRGYKTTTTYQIFDQPSTDSPVGIVTGVGLPEQQTTTIVRDGFGKPLSITRSGTGG